MACGKCRNAGRALQREMGLSRTSIGGRCRRGWCLARWIQRWRIAKIILGEVASYVMP